MTFILGVGVGIILTLLVFALGGFGLMSKDEIDV